MAISKLTSPPSYEDILNKLNELVDAVNGGGSSISWINPTDKVTIGSLTGGYYQIGKRVYVEMAFNNGYTRSVTTSVSTVFFEDLPVPNVGGVALSINVSGKTGFACTIGSDGKLYIRNPSGETYDSGEKIRITGNYLTT